PNLALSRIICPRRLKPKSPYTCFLVPAFELGRLAGLKQKADPSTDALVPAWNGENPPNPLPVYYSWRFGTGGEGDFESLVRRLEPRVIPAGVGRRDMDVSTPGAGLSKANSAPLGLEGALQAPGATPSTWNVKDRAKWIKALARLLNIGSDRITGHN